jgi:hypothetical protein
MLSSFLGFRVVLVSFVLFVPFVLMPFNTHPTQATHP